MHSTLSYVWDFRHTFTALLKAIKFIKKIIFSKEPNDEFYMFHYCPKYIKLCTFFFPLQKV